MIVIFEYPITMKVDNVGSIFLLDTTLVFQRTNHIDVSHHFICDYVDDGTLKIHFLCSEENLTDSFTKNLSDGTFESITSRYVYRE